VKAADGKLENRDTTVEKTLHCAECGWPGVGNMPAGVRVMTSRNGKQVVIGQLSYFRKSSELCSVCREMKSAVATRRWFVEAHAEYLDRIEVKKQLLTG
jgi:hypothetical protein